MLEIDKESEDDDILNKFSLRQITQKNLIFSSEIPSILAQNTKYDCLYIVDVDREALTMFDIDLISIEITPLFVSSCNFHAITLQIQFFNKTFFTIQFLKIF